MFKKIISMLALVPLLAMSTPIIMYHDVSETENGEYTITRDNFIKHLDAMQAAGYKTITVSQYANYIKSESEIPLNTVVITFDDGRSSMAWVNNQLIKRDMSATMYVMSGAFNNSSHLSREELKKISLNPKIEIGAHSVTHFMQWEGDLASLDYRIVLGEMIESKAVIESVIGKPVKSFAWPYGHVNEGALKFLSEVGYTSSIDVSDTSDSTGRPASRLTRVNVSGYCSSESLIIILKSGKGVKC